MSDGNSQKWTGQSLTNEVVARDVRKYILKGTARENNGKRQQIRGLVDDDDDYCHPSMIAITGNRGTSLASTSTPSPSLLLISGVLLAPVVIYHVVV
jgi:hypothetical protein